MDVYYFSYINCCFFLVFLVFLFFLKIKNRIPTSDKKKPHVPFFQSTKSPLDAKFLFLSLLSHQQSQSEQILHTRLWLSKRSPAFLQYCEEPKLSMWFHRNHRALLYHCPLYTNVRTQYLYQMPLNNINILLFGDPRKH